MDQPIATVMDVRGERAIVSVDGATCPRCAAGRGCGAGVFGRSRGPITLSARVPEGLSIVNGQQVTLAVQARSLASASLSLYGLPLGGLLGGSAMAYLLLDAPGDTVALIWAGVGLAAGIIAGGIRVRRDECISALTPIVSGHAGPDTG